MCNLYSMTTNAEAIRKLFRVDKTHGANLPAQKAIFLRYDAPVVRKAEDGSRELVKLRWCFVLKTPQMLKDLSLIHI